MKILHLSDLHIGKRLGEISLLEDQIYILGQITDHIGRNGIDAVIIAGDVYDRSIPSGEAMNVFSDFIEKLSELEVPVLLISGNHDSAERISYFSDIMKKHRIYLVTDTAASTEPVVLRDEYGEVNFYLIPFMRPSDVNNAFETSCASYTEAMAELISRMNIDTSKRNVAVSHQYAAGSSVCDSEMLIGGIESVDAAVYKDFDYTALGHLHTPQNVGGSDRVRYCGTPLKYSLSEVSVPKSMTIVTLGEKGSVSVDTVPFKPLRDMKKLKGSFEELMKGEPSDEYIYVELTDEQDIPYAGTDLRTIYKNFVSVTYSRFGDNNYFAGSSGFSSPEEKSPQELFSEFFMQQHGGKTELNDIQLEILREAIERAWGC